MKEGGSHTNSVKTAKGNLQRTLRSTTGKKLQGKSLFCGRTVLSNKQGGGEHGQKAQHSRRYKMLRRTTTDISLSKALHKMLEKADKRRKKNAHGYTVDLDGLMFPMGLL